MNKKTIGMVALVILILVSILVFNTMIPSMLAFLKFQNETSQELHVLWFDIEENNFQKTEIHPKQEKKVVIYKGESTDVFLNKLLCYGDVSVSEPRRVKPTKAPSAVVGLKNKCGEL